MAEPPPRPPNWPSLSKSQQKTQHGLGLEHPTASGEGSGMDSCWKHLRWLWSQVHWREEVTWGHRTHSLVLLLRLRADDLLHVVGREPQLLLAPVVPPPPARGERIKASGQILGGQGVLTPHAMSGSSRRRKEGGRGTEKKVVKTHHTAGRPAGKPTAPARPGHWTTLTSPRPACRRCG